MIQDTIVLLLITAALANVIYQIVKIGKSKAVHCGGCGQCEIKKEIISKKSL